MGFLLMLEFFFFYLNALFVLNLVYAAADLPVNFAKTQVVKCLLYQLTVV